MGTGRVVGGIIALIGGSLVLITCLLRTEALEFGGPYSIAWIINLIIAAVVLIGGIIGMTGKKLGGILSLIIGLVSILLATLSAIYPFLSFEQIAFEQYSIVSWLGDGIIVYASVEALLMIVGGIIIIASRSDY